MRYLSFILFLLLLPTLTLFADDGDFENVELLGSFGLWDVTNAVAVSGQHVYLATESTGLRIIDVSDPSDPVEVGYFLTSHANGIIVLGETAYLLDSSMGLYIIDISDPSNPTLTANKRLYSGGKIEIVENLAYITCRSGGFYVIDLSDPSNPGEVGYFDSNGNGLDIKIDDNIAYLADGSEGLVAIDISNPSDPDTFGTSSVISYACGIELRDNYMFVVSGNDGFYILDKTDPQEITIVNHLEFDARAKSISVEGDIAYILTQFDGLKVIDISDMENLEVIASLGNYNNAMSHCYYDNKIYEATLIDGLKIIDVETPSSPSEIGFYSLYGDFSNIKVDGNLAYATTYILGLQVFDISEPDNIERLGYSGIVPRFPVSLELRDNFAFTACGNDGLVIFDIEDPTQPSVVSTQNTRNLSNDIKLSGNYAFMPEYVGVRIIDISDLSDPDEVAFFDHYYRCNSIEIAGQYAFIASINNGLSIIDISNPLEPDEIAYYPSSFSNCSVDMANELLYTTRYDSVFIFDISELENPTIINGFETERSVHDILTVDGIAYMAMGWSGTVVYNVTDPNHPYRSGFYDSVFDAENLTYANGLVYTTSEKCLEILDCSAAAGITENDLINIPETFSLVKVYPNPFNPTLNIEIDLPSPGILNLSLFNVTGQHVKTIMNDYRNAGSYTVMLNGSSLSSGVYFLNASIPEMQNQSQKVILVK